MDYYDHPSTFPYSVIALIKVMTLAGDVNRGHSKAMPTMRLFNYL